MTTLVVGASGATGRLLVEQLLQRGRQVRVIVRSTANLPDRVIGHDNLSVTNASVLDLSDAELAHHVRGCDALASCLGHNLTLKGMFGSPRGLVTDATRRLCDERDCPTGGSRRARASVRRRLRQRRSRRPVRVRRFCYPEMPGGQPPADDLCDR